MKRQKRPKGWLRPKTSRAIPKKANSGPSCKLEPPKVLICKGQWMVPPEQRPSGWESMVLADPEKLDRPKPTPRQRFEERKKRGPVKVVIQERHGGYPFRTPVTPEGYLDKPRLAELMRMNPKPAEGKLWQAVCRMGLSGSAAPRFQVLMLGWIVDIYFPAHRLVVEADGPVHHGREKDDHYRDQTFWRRKFSVLRFSNDKIMNDIDAVIAKIKRRLSEIEARTHSPEQMPGSRCMSAAGGSQGKPSSTKLGVRNGELARSQKSEGSPLAQGNLGLGNVISGVAPVR